MLRTGVERGEIRPEIDPLVVTEMIAGAVFGHHAILGLPTSEAWIDSLVEHVWIAIRQARGRRLQPRDLRGRRALRRPYLQEPGGSGPKCSVQPPFCAPGATSVVRRPFRTSQRARGAHLASDAAPTGSLGSSVPGQVGVPSSVWRGGVEVERPQRRHEPGRHADDRQRQDPPPTTLGTVPNRRAATPLSKAPSSFEAPMNTQFTDATRPRIRSGERTRRIVFRMTMLTPSVTPLEEEGDQRQREDRRQRRTRSC